MPTVSVNRDALFKALGTTYTDEEFDEICFQFGIELDEVTSEKMEAIKEIGAKASESLSEEVVYKIETPSNRYDLLCPEGLIQALRVFQGKSTPPVHVLSKPEDMLTITVKPETASIRPYLVCAVLRNIAFTQASYDSFIELQDKLHNGIGRRRAIVSMGTHDLDTLVGPFTYEALAPEQIHFRPLNQTSEMDGRELMAFYEADNKLKKFLHIIRESPIYPVIYDSKRTVLSLPPIINGDHSKIKLTSKNVFIEVTATDSYKAMLALEAVVMAFSQYCKPAFTVEPVRVVYPDGRTEITPSLKNRVDTVSPDYINRLIGINLSGREMIPLLERMMLAAKETSNGALSVTIPPNRADILHACDIMEDVAIAYGFNNVPKRLPTAFCVAAPLPINKLGDQLRLEVALAGFTEVLTLTLCSHDENFAYLRKVDNGDEAVLLSNPKTAEYQVVHTSLVPAMLKTVSANRQMALPLKLFQICDVVIKDPQAEVGARNERHLCAIYCGMTSGFEVIHGLMDRVMQMVGIKAVAVGDTEGYYIKPSSMPMYFEGRQAQVFYNGNCIGSFGILHPKVLEKFQVSNACTSLELNIQLFV